MDDEVHTTDAGEDIGTVAAIQSDFAEWAEMEFGFHKCACRKRESVKGGGDVATLENLPRDHNNLSGWLSNLNFAANFRRNEKSKNRGVDAGGCIDETHFVDAK